MRLLLALLALLALLLATAAQAQQRQPANVSTLPQSTPQEFDLLDNQGNWMPFGTASGGVFTGFGGAGIDVRAFGCVADGVTDQTACINNALAKAPGCVIIPDTPNGFLVTSTIVVRTCLKGQHVSTANTYPNFVYPGASAILCNVGVNGVCIDGATANVLNETPQIENLTISGVAGTPPAGSVGLRFRGGYNTRVKGVAVVNFDNCVVVGPAPGIAPISIKFWDLNLGRCQSHYFTIDGTPEVWVDSGRWGFNGGGEFNALDFVYFTNSSPSGAQGPNSSVFRNLQMNPGSGGSGVQCAVRWGGYAAQPSAPGIIWFTDDYFEWHTDHSPGPTGIFCSDATIATIANLHVVHSTTSTGSTTTPIFMLNAATTPSQWWFNGNNFGGVASTLHTGSPGPSIASNLHFTDNIIPSLTLVSDGSGAAAFLTSNNFGALSISGAWTFLGMNGNSWGTAYTDTATGNIESTAVFPVSFTPALKFAGVEPAGIAYTTRAGSWTRNPLGGFDVSINITLSNKGSGPAPADVATVAGWPPSCSSGLGTAPLGHTANFTGLTGALYGWMSGSALGLGQYTATGSAQLPYSVFTNTTSFDVKVTCGRAL